jgi:RNA polymerase sigma factor (sigma-70 family)
MNRLLTLALHTVSDVRSDQALLAALAANRDGASLAELFRRHAPAVRQVAADVCPAAAEDVVQAAFLLLAERAASLAGRTSAAGWLFQVARRLALKARTAAARRSRHESHAEPASPSAPVLDDLALHEVRALVAEELAGLPDKMRVPLVLHYWEGAAHAEAAARLGCSVSTLKRLLDAGRERLGARLARRGLTGASVLTVLTALQTRATAGFVSTSACGPDPGTAAEIPARVAALARTTGGVSLSKSLAAAACVLAAGTALAIGLTGGERPKPDAVAAAGRQPPRGPDPVPEKAPAPDRDRLPAGAVARLGSDVFHHGGMIDRVFVTPDGRHAVSAGVDALTSNWDMKAKLWDLATGKELPSASGKVPDGPGGVRVAAVTPAGKSLALVVIPREQKQAGDVGGWVVDSVGGSVLAEFPRTVVWGRSALHPDGKRVATVTIHGPPGAPQQYQILLWGLGKEKAPTELLPPQRRNVHRIQFSPDGRYLAAQYAGGKQLDIVEVAGARVVLTVEDSDPTQAVYDAFAFSPNGKLFAKEAREKNQLRVWSIADGKERSIPCEDGHWGVALAFDPTGAFLAHLADGKLRVHNLQLGVKALEVRCRGGLFGGFDVAFTPDGRVVTAENADLIIRDGRTGEMLAAGPHRSDIAHVVWAGSKRVATWDRDSGTPGRVWDAATGRQAATVAGHTDGCRVAAASPDGSLLATAGAQISKNAPDTTVRLWSAADGGELAVFRPAVTGADRSVRALWFAPDGKTLFGLAHRTGYVWDVAAKRELRPFAHPLALVSAAYPVTGTDRVIVTGWLPVAGRDFIKVGEDPCVVLTLDTKTGQEVGKRVEFGRDALVGVSPDGRYAFRRWYGSPTDHQADVWDLAIGRSVGRIDESDGKTDSPWVEVGAFAPDMRTFSVGYTDGTVRVYEWATRAERLRFVHGAGIRILAYSPDGTRLASAGSRWGLLWDLTRSQAPVPKTETDSWAALAGTDPKAGLAAVRYFADRPAEAVRYLKDRVRPVPTPDPKQVGRWVEQLGSAEFAEREAAGKQLASVADAARSQLTDAAATTTSPEVRDRLGRILAPVAESAVLTGEPLRAERAIEALEAIGTPEARDLLTALAAGAPDARVTRRSAAAQKRLGPTR